jgi:diguanylate cyclase (GGDEF)-like protein/PAS domain S-box-containing protein
MTELQLQGVTENADICKMDLSEAVGSQPALPDSPRSRIAKEITDPSLLVLPLVAAAFCVLRFLNLIAHEPYWVYVAVVMGAACIRLAHVAFWAMPEGTWQRFVNIGVSLAVIAVVAYCTGWGPILSIGFIFGAATALEMFGSSATLPCLIFTATFMVFGQIAIILHFAPSLIREPAVEGVAVLGLLGALLVIELLGRATADQERLAGQLRRSERRFAALVTRSSDIVLVVSPDGLIQFASPAFEAVLGYPIAETQSLHGAELVHPDDGVAVRSALDTAESSESTTHQEFRLRRSDGSYLWFEAALTNLTADPDVGGIVANMRDITRRKDAEDRLAHAALHDSLTGLPNRSLIHNRIEQMQARAKRQRISTAVLFIDLDDFKDINDTLGHEAGDQLLAAVAARLSTALREGDTVGRLGGDEFVVLVDDASTGGGEMVAERVRNVLAPPFQIAACEVPLHVTASIGIAEAERASPGELLRDADIALYRAKSEGKDRWVTFVDSMHQAVNSHRDLEVDLKCALEEGQFFLQYQPTIDLVNGMLNGVEALLRWRHPERGVVQPSDFIFDLERTGLIVPVGAWVLREACEQSVRWNSKGYEMSMSVNVSAIQLERDRVIDDVHRALESTGIDPSSLILELTESALMHDVDATLTRLKLLKALGVRLAIDDFGTGYSSLSYLRQFPIDVLKIDQSFVSGMVETAESAAIVHTPVQLGKVLGLTTVAEGVESNDQRELLKAEGVNVGQGYLFSKPLEVSGVEELFRLRSGNSRRAAAQA